jgi:ribosomal protein L31
VTYDILPTQKTYHTFNVPSVGANNGTIIVVTVGGVQRGSVQVLLSQATPLSYCPCFRHVHAMNVAQNELDSIVLSYCEITNVGTWTAEVVGVSAVANQAISYTLTIETRAQTPKTLTVDTVSSDNARDSQYVYYALPSSIMSNDEILVTLSNVRGGAVSVYYNTDNPATDACATGSMCVGTLSSCSGQIGSCEPTPRYLSVLASATTADPVFWDIEFSLNGVTPIPPSSEIPNVVINAGFTLQYSLTVPAHSAGPFVSVILSNIVNGPLEISVRENRCDYLSVSKTCAGGATTCELDLGSCLLSQTDFFVIIRSIVPGANVSQDVSFDLLVNVVSTAVTILPLAPNAAMPTQEMLSGYQWRMYSIVVDLGAPPQPKKVLTIDTSSGTPLTIDYYLRYAATPTDYPSSYPCQQVQSGNCTGVSPCSMTLDSCCLKNGTYYLGVRNKDSAPTTFEVQATLSTTATFVAHDNSPLQASITGLKPGQQLAEVVMQVAPSNLTSANVTSTAPSQLPSILYFQVQAMSNVANTSNSMSVYVQHASLAGSAAPCFTNVIQCTNSASCLRQLLPCSAGVSTLAGSYYVGVHNNDAQWDLDASVALTIQQPTVLPVTAPADGPGDSYWVDGTANVYTYFMIAQVNTAAATALASLDVVLTQPNASHPTLYMAVSSVSMCLTAPTACTTTVNTPTCTVALQLCSTSGPFYVGVRTANSNTGSSFNLAVHAQQRTPLYELQSAETLQNTTESIAPGTGSVYFSYNATNATIGATSHLQFSIVQSSGTVSGVYLAHSSPFCFATADSCSNAWIDSVDNSTGTPVALRTCTISISSCALVAEMMYLRVAVQGGQPTNITVSYSMVQPVAQLDTLTVNSGAPLDGSLHLYDTAYYRLSLGNTSIGAGQVLDITATTLCGQVAVYVSTNGIAGKDCQAACTAGATYCTASSFRISACDLMRNGIDTEYYVSVVATAQAFAAYGVPTHYYLLATVVGERETFVMVDAGERVSYMPPTDLPPLTPPPATDALSPTYYVYPFDGIGQYAGSTVFTFEAASATKFTIYYDLPPVCISTTDLPTSSQTCTVGNTATSCSITVDSCTANAHRFVYFAFPLLQEASVTVGRPTPYVRNWNLMSGALGTVLSGALAQGMQDIEFYEFTVDRTTQSWFRLQIELRAVTPNIELWYSTLAPPSQCSTGTTTCSTALNADGSQPSCVLTFDACQVTSDTMYLGVAIKNGAAVPSIATYSLRVRTSVTPRSIGVNQEVCQEAAPNALTFFSAPITNFTVGNTYRVSVYGIETGSVQLLLNGYQSSGGPNLLATPNCYAPGFSATCDPVVPCQLEWACPLSSVLSITVQNLATTNNTFFVMWELLTETIAPIAWPAGRVSGMGAPTLVHYSFTTPTLSSTQLLLGTLVAESPMAAMYWSWDVEVSKECFSNRLCTGRLCTLVDPCNYRAGAQLYVTIDSNALPYSVQLAIEDVSITPVSLGIAYEGALTTLGVYTSFQYSLPNNGLDPTQQLSLSLYGINQGSIDLWINTDTLGDRTCALQSTTTMTASSTITIPACSTFKAKSLIITMTANSQTELCTAITFGMQLTLYRPYTARQPTLALTLGKPATYNVLPSTSYDLFSLSLANLTPDSVLVISLTASDTSTQLAPPTLTGTLLATGGASAPFCARTIPTIATTNTNEPLVVMACDLANAMYYISVMSTQARSPLAQYTLLASMMQAHNLFSQPLYSPPAGQAALQFAYLDFAQLWAPSNVARSLTILLNVQQGSSVTVELWPELCTSATNTTTGTATVYSSYTCFTGATCIVPFAWSSDLLPPRYTMRITSPTSSANAVATNYTLSYATAHNNCHQQPQAANLTFCSGINYSWWKYADSDNLDAAASSTFDALVAAFCPECSCRQLSTNCLAALERYACEWTFRPCNSNGFKSTVCGNTCTEVEEACATTFLEAGLANLECNHNWYATSSESACQDNSYTPSNYVPSSGHSWWFYAVIVVGSLFALLLLVSVVAAFVVWNRSKPRSFERIVDHEDERAPLSNS